MTQTNMYVCRMPRTVRKKHKERAENLGKS